MSTLCWDCKKACGGCSWSKDFVPIENWEAEETEIKNTNQDRVYYIKSYLVKSCPEFADICYEKELTYKEVCKKLNISLRTYFRWIKNKIIDKHGNIINKKRIRKKYLIQNINKRFLEDL